MSKIEGDQNIPSELLDLYRGTLGRGRDPAHIKTRNPYRLPTMQEGGLNVRKAQTAQRERFKTARDKFKTLSSAERQRWYENEPPWSSFLWYYNYFIMSSLVGNANTNQGGLGVIKSIQFVTGSMSTGSPANVNISISTVNPDKCVAMLYGAGAYEAATGAFCSVYPIPVSITATQVTIRNSAQNDVAYTAGVIVIEYI